MGGETSAADAAARMARGYEIIQLAARVLRCSESVEGIVSGFRDIQCYNWQSPAGRAYRDSVALQEVALSRARERLDDASAAVNRHAREVAASAGTAVGRY